MNNLNDNSRKDSVSDFKKNDESYSVEKRTSMTIGELIDGIRDKIQRTLKKNVTSNESYSGKGG